MTPQEARRDGADRGLGTQIHPPASKKRHWRRLLNRNEAALVGEGVAEAGEGTMTPKDHTPSKDKHQRLQLRRKVQEAATEAGAEEQLCSDFRAERLPVADSLAGN